MFRSLMIALIMTAGSSAFGQVTSPPPAPGVEVPVPEVTPSAIPSGFVTLEHAMVTKKDIVLLEGSMIKNFSPPEDMDVTGGLMVDGIIVIKQTTLFAEESYLLKITGTLFSVPKGSTFGKGSIVPSTVVPDPVYKIGKKGFKGGDAPDAQSVSSGFAVINNRLDQIDHRIGSLEARVTTLEERAPVPGPRGPAGPQGPQGPVGTTYYVPVSPAVTTNCRTVYRR